MDTHEYADKLKQLAEFLLSKPAFEAEYPPAIQMWYWQHKDKFLAAVRALGSGKKEYENSGSSDTADVLFHVAGVPAGTTLTVRVARAAVCRKVQEEKWECESLLSQAEESELARHEQG